MGDITTIGLDLAKNVFQVPAVDEAGNEKRPPTDGVDGPLTASMCQSGGRQRSPVTGAIHGRYYNNWS